MKYNFINNLSLFRTAVIQKFLLINIYPDTVKFLLLKRKESFFKLSKTDAGNNFVILSSEHFDWMGDYFFLKSKLKEFIKTNNLKDIAVFIGINEFKFSTVTVQADTEDIDLWFLENSAKFLPEGRPADEFGFSYEKIKEDESHKYFNLVVIRSNYVNEIIKNLSAEGIRIYGIFPFHLAICSYDNPEEKNRLLLDFSSSKVLYSYLSRVSIFFSGEIFNQYIIDDDSIRKIDEEEVNSSLLQIKQNLTLNFGNNSIEQLEVYLCSRKEDYEILKSNVEKVFYDSPINSSHSTEEYAFLPSIFAYNKILKDNDLKINLLPQESQVKERELVEKQMGLKVILAIGGVIIFLLLLSNVLDGFLRSSLEEEQTNAITVNSETMKLNSLQKENQSCRLITGC